MNLQRGSTYMIDSEIIKHVVPFKSNYLVFILLNHASNNTLCIFDKANKYYAYYNSMLNKIYAINTSDENIYVYIENEHNYKQILCLKRKG